MQSTGIFCCCLIIPLVRHKTPTQSYHRPIQLRNNPCKMKFSSLVLLACSLLVTESAADQVSIITSPQVFPHLKLTHQTFSRPHRVTYAALAPIKKSASTIVPGKANRAALKSRLVLVSNLVWAMGVLEALVSSIPAL